MSKAKKVQMGKDKKIRQKQRAEAIKKNLCDKKHISKRLGISDLFDTLV